VSSFLADKARKSIFYAKRLALKPTWE